MGNLRQLDCREHTVHLLYTNSGLAEIYVYDRIKEAAKADLNSIFTIDSRSSFNQMLELVNVEPNLSEKWMFVIEYRKVKSQLRRYIGVFESTSSLFLVKVNSYKEFQEFKELRKVCNDLYLTLIRGHDIMVLLAEFRLNQNLMDYITKSYSRDVEKVFVLRQALLNGQEVETPKDVIRICGESASTTIRFVFLLLNELPKSKSGLKRVYKKRLTMLYDMVDSLGSLKTYNYIQSTVRDILYIKMLYLSGQIYDQVRDIPDAFDEKKLSRYGIYIHRIATEIPYERILRLYTSLRDYGGWYTQQDSVLFLYNYYLMGCKIDWSE